MGGKIDELLFEGKIIQSRLHHINTGKSIGELSKKFVLLMEKGNVNGALKLLTSNMSNGILPLDDQQYTSYGVCPTVNFLYIFFRFIRRDLDWSDVI